MAYTTINKSGDYFNTITYTGNATGSTARTVGFDPDWIWVKNRGGADNHYLMDKVRGLDYNLETNNADAQARDYLISGTTSTGWTSSNSGEINANNGTFVAWNWKAGGGQGSSNTDGSINTTYTSVNTTAGFSISSFTGTGANATFGHGLGAVPKMYILKRYDASNNWRVYHESLGNGKYLTLETTEAEQTSSGFTNNTSPTSSLISLGNLGSANPSGGSVICYAFAEKTGYSKFGSYTGNGNANGPFIYTGFKPAFILQKRINDTSNWHIFDIKRDTYNSMNKYLLPNDSAAESTAGAWDFLSNGFKVRSADNWQNQSGGTYMYMAFAEAPLVGSNGVTAKAR